MAKGLTITEAQSKKWDSKEEMESEFKRARLRLVGADYMQGQDAEGKWCLVDRPPPDEGGNVVRLGSAKKKAASPKKAPAPKRQVEGEPGEYKGPVIKGGPVPSRLPDGFVPWAIEMGCRDDGVSRKELSTQSGQNGAKWYKYMTEIGQTEGFKCRMGKKGRYNNFWLFKD